MASRSGFPLTRLFLLAILVLWGCGGGGGGRGGGNNPPTDPGPALVFLPSGAGGPRTLELTATSISGARLVVALEVESVADLYGVAFDLTYPSNFLDFVSAREGDHLNGGGTLNTSFQIVENPTGTLVVGLSRLGDVAGAGGSGSLLELTFEAQVTGEGQLRFVRPRAADSTGVDIGGLTFSGGTVRATF